MQRWSWVGVLALSVGLWSGARPAAAQTTITGGSALLNATQANQLGSWLGEGPITINRIFTKLPGMTSAAFHGAVDGKGRTFSVVEVTGAQGTKLIGGYNPQSWDSHGHVHATIPDAERTAFLFNLTHGFKQDQKKSNDPTGGYLGEVQTLNRSDFGPTFGGGYDMFVHGSLNAVNFTPFSYGTNNPIHHTGANIYGTTGWAHNLTVGRMEVFTISDESASAVPEPSSVLLFLPALVAVGILKRRRSA